MTESPSAKTAMIVEDNPLAARLLENAVRRSGYEVTVHGSAEEAWECFIETSPRLILLDWGLPGMDGLTLCRKIRATPHGRYVAILMVTSRSEPEDLEAAIMGGVDYFMAKGASVRMMRAWLTVADKRMADLVEREQRDLQIMQYREDLETGNQKLQEAIDRASQLTMAAERAYSELNQIFATVAGGILLIDSNFRIIRCNYAYLLMAGVAMGEATAKHCYETFPSHLCHTEQCPLVRIVAGEPHVESQVSRQLPRQGGLCHYHIISRPFRGPSGELIGIVKHITDITKRVEAEAALKESERRYRKLSVVDELTRLFNKRHLNNVLPLELERGRRYSHPLSLLLMDIDDFKRHNDTYGHPEGDKVLGRLGMVISDSLRVNDIPCRYGGEEFVVVLPETSGANALVVAERIRERFAAEVFAPAPGVRVRKTVSVGIAEYVAGEEMSTLIERADGNMYKAKKQGKNRVVSG